MKRGLVVLDETEIPAEEWQQRVTLLQQRMMAEGISLVLIYGDVYSSDDIGYLTNLCIYWNEGVLAVPSHGSPIFLTKLSPRVHPWMRATSNVSDLRSGKDFGQLVQTLLRQSDPGVVGLVDAALWPAQVVEEITAALPSWEVRRLGGIVREQRLFPSSSELELLRTAAGETGRAFDEVGRCGSSIQQRIAIVEREMRGCGFTDLVARASTTADGVTSLEVTGQYRQSWVHRGELVCPENPFPSWAAALNAAQYKMVAAVTEGAEIRNLAIAAGPELSTLPDDASWGITCMNQVDLATGGEYQSATLVEGLASRTVVAVGIEVFFGDCTRAAVAETVLVQPDGVELLTASPPAEPGASRRKEFR